jgi:ribonucleoside-diphosphate reductase alpha chain
MPAVQKYTNGIDHSTVLQGMRNKLFLDRYSLKDQNGEPVEKAPEEMWRRVAVAIAAIEKTPKLRKLWEEKFYTNMLDFKFSPGGRFLTSAGTGTDTTMINCYVIPDPEDTRAGIIKTLGIMTEISARGGGVGFNISSLRPRGGYLKSVNGTTSGAVSWANLYSMAAHDIIQQGGSRRGALMIMMWDWHPDLLEFITVKKETGKMEGANLSVCISDAFMQAIKDDANWDFKFPDTDSPHYRGEWDGDIETWQEKKYPVKVYKTIKAREVWNQICESAWASAEPGIVFMDRYNQMNNTWYFEKIVSVNVCGEQGLPAWGVCNLGSLNLAAFVKNGNFDFNEFEEAISISVRFLDNAIDSEKYLYPEIAAKQKSERRQGLGTMGLADALIKMQIRYGSEESLELIESIFKTLRDTAYATSIDLAGEKGKFPLFNAAKYLKSGFMATMPETLRKKIAKEGIRNALILTEAPTGKTSILAGVSSGIEPIFSFSYLQKDRLGERLVYHQMYKDWVDAHGESNIPNYFVTANDLTPDEHVKVQALIQKYTDSSISKTVNAPESHTINDVKNLYTEAYELGCKGIAYMREGSREGTLVRTEKNEPKTLVVTAKEWERPVRVSGSTYRLKTPVGTAFITVNHDEDGSPIELFINIGKAGTDIQAMAEALGRLVSKTLSLSVNTTPAERATFIVDQLKGIGGMRSVGFGDEKILSLPDAVAKALAIDSGLIAKDKPKMFSHADFCPACGNATLVHEMGCKTCHGCGYSAC